MSLKKFLAGVLGVAINLVAPGWSGTVASLLGELEPKLLDTLGAFAVAECKSLVPQAFTGIEKLARVAQAIVSQAEATGVKVTQDLAILIAQRAYLQIVPTIEADLKTSIASIKDPAPKAAAVGLLSIGTGVSRLPQPMPTSPGKPSIGGIASPLPKPMPVSPGKPPIADLPMPEPAPVPPAA